MQCHLCKSLRVLRRSCAQVSVGYVFYRMAWAGLRHSSGNMSLLIALGTTAAFVYSTFVMVRRHAPTWNQSMSQGHAPTWNRSMSQGRARWKPARGQPARGESGTLLHACYFGMAMSKLNLNPPSARLSQKPHVQLESELNTASVNVSFFLFLFFLWRLVLSP